ncbi:MAG: hypothetical protein MMC33_001329 [Icmadophila ericetorum]|nr:hypothetical protein [Icmadophila ericetorum]
MTKLRRKIRLWPRKQSESHASDYRSATEDERAILKKAAWRWQTATVTCSVCTEEVKRSKFPEHPITSACTHPLTDICTKCLQTHLEVQVSSTTGLGIPCPICRSPLSYPDMQRNAAAEIFARYSERDAHNTIEHTPGFIWCPISGCGSGQIHEGGADAPIVTCVNCRQLFCFTHRRKWHAGLTCEQVDEDPLLEEELEGEQITQSTKRRGLSEKERRENEAKKAERATRRKEEQLGEEMAKRISKRCIGPNCNWRAEKDNGCKHVTCVKCKFEYCFQCLRPWKTGHLSENCQLSSDEESKTAEREYQDIIAESMRTAEEERRARQEIEGSEEEEDEGRGNKISVEPPVWLGRPHCPTQ